MPRGRGVNRELHYLPAGELRKRKTWPDREDLTEESTAEPGTTEVPNEEPAAPTEEDDGPATPDTA
jgi:hypothetical protein